MFLLRKGVVLSSIRVRLSCPTHTYITISIIVSFLPRSNTHTIEKCKQNEKNSEPAKSHRLRLHSGSDHIILRSAPAPLRLRTQRFPSGSGSGSGLNVSRPAPAVLINEAGSQEPGRSCPALTLVIVDCVN